VVPSRRSGDGVGGIYFALHVFFLIVPASCCVVCVVYFYRDDQRGMIWCFHNKAICTLFQTERIIGGHKWFDLCLDPIEVRTQFSTTHIYKSDLYPLSTWKSHIFLIALIKKCLYAIWHTFAYIFNSHINIINYHVSLKHVKSKLE
jgi:hypothetical protein